MSHSCSGSVLCLGRHDVLRDIIATDVLCDIIDISALQARFKGALSYENGSDFKCVEVVDA